MDKWIEKQVSNIVKLHETVDLKKNILDFEDRGVQISRPVPNIEAKNNKINDFWAVQGIVPAEIRPIFWCLHGTKIHKDSELTSRIKKKLDQFPIIDAREIKVSANKGIVTLTGYIDAYWKYKRVQDLCNNIIGVLGVINKLVVVPPRKDFYSDIKTDILNALEHNLFIDSNSITVAVKKGTVTLSGNVKSWIEHGNILRIVEKIQCVKDIIDNLLIDSFVNIMDKISISR